jgi:hypothetical protein
MAAMIPYLFEINVTLPDTIPKTSINTVLSEPEMVDLITATTAF